MIVQGLNIHLRYLTEHNPEVNRVASDIWLIKQTQTNYR